MEIGFGFGTPWCLSMQVKWQGRALIKTPFIGERNRLKAIIQKPRNWTKNHAKRTLFFQKTP